ncbi:ABC transporter permease [Parashewanella spongiae]|uniref:ABC transporter permease n=1 Tax=Parashewanella spongiae TaxID=342950 RepID=A0A3A6TXC2_9GAMM|nr:ABC transporter permease [Parashewanella spongiae]MCL1077014.1 hypothetical protein [Parashewanella spongiae]RJY19119.1 ABC transporter permease [Parashewanella spongiae]
MSFYLRALQHGVMRLFTLPRLTLPVLLTLSLTLAAVLTVVAMSSNLIFKPLPDIKDEDSLYIINNEVMLGEMSMSIFNSKAYAHLADDYRSIGDFAALDGDQFPALFNVSETQYDSILFTASHNIFDVTDREIILGDAPTIDNIAQGVWISETLWRSALESRKGVIGEQIKINNKTHLVKGVVTDFVSFSIRGIRNTQQVWSLYNLQDFKNKDLKYGEFTGNFTSLFRVKTRLITAKEVGTFWEKYKVEHIESTFTIARNIKTKVNIVKYRDSLLLEQENMVWFLIAAVTALLLMASLNLLNLFIGYYQQRYREFALQISLGATKSRLFAMVFFENLAVFIASAFTGLVLAAWIIRLLPIISGGNIKFIDLIQLDSYTSIVAILLVMGINLFFALVVVFRFDDNTLLEQVSSGNKGVSRQSMGLLSKAIFVLQISAAAILLTTLAMVGNSAWSDLNIDYGFKAGNTLVVKATFDENFRKYDRENQSKQEKQLKSYTLANRVIKQQIINKLSELDSSIQVLSSNADPYIGMNGSVRIRFDPDTNTTESFRVVDVAHDFISQFEIPLLYGRNITQQEYTTLAPVQLNNQTSAKHLSKGEPIKNLIGTQFWGKEIVGIIADNVRVGEHDTKFAVSYFANTDNISSMVFVMQLPEAEVFDVNAIESLIKNSHPQITEIKSLILKEYMWRALDNKLLQFYFIMVLSLLTLLLAAFGTTGMALSFAEIKRFELAIRMATGASRAMLLNNMLKSFSGLLSTTMVVALVSSALIYYGLQQQISALPAFSWEALLFFSAILVTIVFAAIFWVIWRVINAEPMQALREL